MTAQLRQPLAGKYDIQRKLGGGGMSRPRSTRVSSPVRALFALADQGEIEIVTSALTLLKVLAVPLCDGDAVLASQYDAAAAAVPNGHTLEEIPPHEWAARSEVPISLGRPHRHDDAMTLGIVHQVNRSARDVSFVDLNVCHTTAYSARIPDRDLIRRVHVAVVDSELGPGARHARVDRQPRPAFGEAENRLDGHAVRPPG